MVAARALVRQEWVAGCCCRCCLPWVEGEKEEGEKEGPPRGLRREEGEEGHKGKVWIAVKEDKDATYKDDIKHVSSISARLFSVAPCMQP